MVRFLRLVETGSRGGTSALTADSTNALEMRRRLGSALHSLAASPSYRAGSRATRAWVFEADARAPCGTPSTCLI